MLGYFFFTRVVRNRAQTILFLVQYLVPIWIISELSNHSARFFSLAVFSSLIGFLLAYEIGYIYNDYFDDHGSRVKSRWPKSKRGASLIILLNFAAIIALVEFSLVSISHFLLFCSVILVFVLHTYISPRHRTPTFVALNLTKVTFFGVVATGVSVQEVIPISIAITLPQAWKYYAKKSGRSYVPSNWVSMFLSLFFVLLVSGTLAATVATISLFGLFFLSIRKNVNLAEIRATELVSHAHTCLSHDASLTLADYGRIPHRVYLTDHAEDVNVSSFYALQKDASQFSGKFIVGLEYPWVTEHILAINLQTPQMHPLESLEQVSGVCDELIWAHPNPSIRRLIRDIDYRHKIWSIFKFVDSVEWSNAKALRRNHKFGVRMAAWALLFHFLKGARNFYIGADLHHVADFDGLLLVNGRGRKTHLLPTKESE